MSVENTEQSVSLDKPTNPLYKDFNSVWKQMCCGNKVVAPAENLHSPTKLVDRIDQQSEGSWRWRKWITSKLNWLRQRLQYHDEQKILNQRYWIKDSQPAVGASGNLELLWNLNMNLLRKGLRSNDWPASGPLSFIRVLLQHTAEGHIPGYWLQLNTLSTLVDVVCF